MIYQPNIRPGDRVCHVSDPSFVGTCMLRVGDIVHVQPDRGLPRVWKGWANAWRPIPVGIGESVNVADAWIVSADRFHSSALST